MKNLISITASIESAKYLTDLISCAQDHPEFKLGAFDSYELDRRLNEEIRIAESGEVICVILQAE